MSEALLASPQAESPYPEKPSFAQPHPAVTGTYLLSDHHFNFGVAQTGDQCVVVGRQTPQHTEWGTPDITPLDAMILERGYGDRWQIGELATILNPPEPDNPTQPDKNTSEDWRGIWTPHGFVFGASDVRKHYNIATGVTDYTPSPAKWHSPSVRALMRGDVTKTPYRQAEIDHTGQQMSLDGKNFGANKFPLGPNGRASEVKYFHRLQGEGNSHTWLLLTETAQKGLRIDQTMSIPKVPWNEDMSGTGGPLIWINPYTAICISHGYSKKVKDVGYYYSVGWGLVTVDPITGICSMPYLDPRPLYTPDSDTTSDGTIPELSPMRRVTYTNGHITTRDPKYRKIEMIELLLNQKDQRTLVVAVNPAEMISIAEEVIRQQQHTHAAGRLSLAGLQITPPSQYQWN